METDQRQPWEDFLQKKRDVQQLREALAARHAEKEKAYESLAALRNQLKTQAVLITTLRQERDALTDGVKALKAEREKVQVRVQEKSLEKEEVEQQWKKLREDLSLEKNPARIAEYIAAIEKKIETEVMPFSQELVLTKKTKELKGKLRQVQELSRAEQRKNTVAADFAGTRREAQDFHTQVQAKARQSQEKHERMLATLQELKKLREEEQPLAEQHLTLKVQYHEGREKLNLAFQDLRAWERLFEKNTALRRQKARALEEEQLAKMREAVEEKLKKGQKLRMEDILAFQTGKDTD
ncbi:hypothetical protein HYS49_01515 [Candidatus Woesearchaeota archaeon]|nr:hypothetical protein [Candidatus Woesearchaeota archaeon]